MVRFTKKKKNRFTAFIYWIPNEHSLLMRALIAWGFSVGPIENWRIENVRSLAVHEKVIFDSICDGSKSSNA